MISQPRISWTMLGARTIVSMPAENSVMLAKKCVYRRSPRTYSVEYSCTSVEMKATRISAITASPSMCSPIPNSMPPDCHHVHCLTTGATSSPWAASTRSIHW